MEHNWASPVRINRSQGARTDETQIRSANALPVENPRFNLNNTPVDDGQSSYQDPSSLRNPDQYSLNINNNTVDGRHLSCKRKSIEGQSSHYRGESSSVQSASAHQSANTTLSISTASNHPSGFSLSTEDLQRNCRTRNNPEHQGSILRASDPFVSFNQFLESTIAGDSGTRDSQSPILQFPALVQNTRPFPVDIASSSRTGSSSTSLAITGQRSNVLREEANSRSFTSNYNVSQHTSGPSNTLLELRRQRIAALRLQLSHIRSATGVLDDLSVAARESRRRMLSEVRDVLSRRGEDLHIEAVQRVLLYDRHRDMRLDVDNMSYEELLALTERIGNVSTGISEETIVKCLKQRKYISLTEETPSDVEPCCICQEEYVEEDEVGRLDCGHDFHTDCIKQWLMMKNLCPICKTTGIANIK
ncbi:probable E3 ubiquitin-protein ligase HIP1 isoform X2 [Asparagus officinalis]|nr:probable E3 ubiquitin-protein ligase HIP1 isoform X2 [Asparagus officinalis]